MRRARGRTAKTGTNFSSKGRFSLNLNRDWRQHERKVHAHGNNPDTDHRTDRGRERHRGSDWDVFSVEARGLDLQGALPVSSGENAVVHGESVAANVSLFRVR